MNISIIADCDQVLNKDMEVACKETVGIMCERGKDLFRLIHRANDNEMINLVKRLRSEVRDGHFSLTDEELLSILKTIAREVEDADKY